MVIFLDRINPCIDELYNFLKKLRIKNLLVSEKFQEILKKHGLSDDWIVAYGSVDSLVERKTMGYKKRGRKENAFITLLQHLLGVHRNYSMDHGKRSKDPSRFLQFIDSVLVELIRSKKSSKVDFNELIIQICLCGFNRQDVEECNFTKLKDTKNDKFKRIESESDKERSQREKEEIVKKIKELILKNTWKDTKTAIELLKTHTGMGLFFDPYQLPDNLLWNDVGEYFLRREPKLALYVFKSHLETYLKIQKNTNLRIHKGTPYHYIGRAFEKLNNKDQEKRNFLLAFIENILTEIQYKAGNDKLPEIENSFECPAPLVLEMKLDMSKRLLREFYRFVKDCIEEDHSKRWLDPVPMLDCWDLKERNSESGGRKQSFEFDVALSFAGEDRVVVKGIAVRLQKRGIKVFYDDHNKASLWGKRLDEYFRKVYGKKSRFVIVFISKHYPQKDWTNFELEIARDEAKRRKQEFILPVRLDDTKMFGISEVFGQLEFSKESEEVIIDLLIQKLKKKDLMTTGEEFEDEQQNQKFVSKKTRPQIRMGPVIRTSRDGKKRFSINSELIRDYIDLLRDDTISLERKIEIVSSLRYQAYKVLESKYIPSDSLSVVKILIEGLFEQIKSEQVVIPSLEALYLLTKACPESRALIKETCYGYFKELYKLYPHYENLVKILDELGHFKDRVDEIFRCISEKNETPLRILSERANIQQIKRRDPSVLKKLWRELDKIDPKKDVRVREMVHGLIKRMESLE